MQTFRGILKVGFETLVFSFIDTGSQSLVIFYRHIYYFLRMFRQIMIPVVNESPFSCYRCFTYGVYVHFILEIGKVNCEISSYGNAYTCQHTVHYR